MDNNYDKFKLLKTGKITIFTTMLGLSLILSCNNVEKKSQNFSKNTNKKIELLNDGDTIKEEYTYHDLLCEKVDNISKNYAYVFGLKDEVLSNVTKQYINNSSIDSLIYNNNILGTDEKYDTIDIQIVLIAKELSNDPSKYGYKKEEVYCPKTESNLTIRELVYKYADAFNLDRDDMLSIACAESGWFKKEIATKKNNPYAHRKNGRFITYGSLEEGILEGQLNLKLNYYSKGLTTIDSCAKKHCPEDPKGWALLVKGVHKQILNGYSLYDEDDKNLVMKIK